MEEFKKLRPFAPIYDSVFKVECKMDLGEDVPYYNCRLHRWTKTYPKRIYESKVKYLVEVDAGSGAEIKSGLDDTKSLLITEITYPELFSCGEFGTSERREAELVLKCRKGVDNYDHR